MPDNLQAAKKALRERIIAQRNALDASIRGAHSAHIVERLLLLPEYRDANIVAAYAAFGSELDTAVFLSETLAAGKQLLLPRIDKAERQLELRRVEDPAADLVAGVWGIREPGDHCPQLPAAEVDFILVPGVAFSVRGERLGYGGGFYDRLLAGVSPQVCRTAAAFSLQMVEVLPTGDRDQRMNCIVTELETLRALRAPRS